MSDEKMNELLARLREEYNAPPETPRDEMWSVIEAGLAGSSNPVVSLDEARLRRRPRRTVVLGWAAAAAAVLVVGVGIGRMTARVSVPVQQAMAPGAGSGAFRAAAAEHLGQTEDLLTLVRADARSGRLDPVVRPWARELLTETRLLLDAPSGVDVQMRELLEDLELALVQIVGVAEADGVDDGQAGVELDLAVRGLDNRELLPRLQAVLPERTGLAGT